MKYDTLEEAQSRLKGTLIYLGDSPIYVRDITDTANGTPYRRGMEQRFQLHYYTIGRDRRPGHVSLADPGLRQNNFKLGYCNIDTNPLGFGVVKNRTAYVTRIPTRRTKQGICQENLLLATTEREIGGVRFGDIHMTESVKDMLTGNYPSLDAACEAVVNGSYSMAFHRHFAVSYDDFRGDMVLMYRGNKIGFGDPDMITLGPQYQFCREAAIEAGIKRIK